MAIGSPQWMYKSGEAYEIDQSLRFESSRSTYLSKTPTSAGNQKTWTWSGWVTKTKNSRDIIMSTTNGGTSFLSFGWTSGGTYEDKFYLYWYDGSTDYGYFSTRLFRDYSSFYHIVLAVDTTQATESNRIKLYVNGVEEPFAANNVYGSFPQNHDTYYNNNNVHYIGYNHDSSSAKFNGYLAEVHSIDGQALTPADFGETGDYGEWKPIEYSGTYGTNGFYLPFKQDYTVEGFSTVTYKGAGADQYIGGTGFKPDMVWIKSRSNAEHHQLYDSVRGAYRDVIPNLTAAEGNTIADADAGLVAFNTDGFSCKGDTARTNGSGKTYVAWNWDMGGSNATNTNGSITSTVRANPTYGQSIVSWTMPSSGSTTVGHGLNSTPELIIQKRRDGTSNWSVYTATTGKDKKLLLHDTAASANSGDWDNTAPTSSLFTSWLVNGTADMIAYCFHSVTGYSKIGSYTGNGSATGPSVTTGFKVGFLLTKCVDSATGWAIVDNTRTPTNPVEGTLYPDKSDAEYTGDQHHIDLNDNGFQIKNSNSRFNTNGDTYIYMAFADKREYAYWLDQSGNNNDWTSNNLTESDISVDSPTNNFATFNPLNYDTTYASLSEGNLKASGTGAGDSGGVLSTMGVSSGKWYWEFYIKEGQYNTWPAVGATDLTIPVGTRHKDSRATWKLDGSGEINVAGSNFTEESGQDGTDFTTGDIIQVAVDMDNGKLWFGKNNTYINSGSPTGGSGQQVSIGSGAIIAPFAIGYDTAFSILNTGQDSSFAGTKTAQGNQDGNGIGDFYYTPPTGFLALCTKNLPNVAVVPSENFNTVLYTGDGNSTKVINADGITDGVDVAWVKVRSTTGNHLLVDSVRTGGCHLKPNTTDAASCSDPTITFSTNSFTTHKTWNSINGSGYTYVAWLWKANGSGSSNTDGSITSTVSANVDAGFSIVKWTGNGTTGHGLSSAPEMIIVKPVDVTGAWWTWHKDLSNTSQGYLQLNTTAAEATNSSLWDNASPVTSTTINANTAYINYATDNYITYCFHSVDGYSKVGSYTGNGNADGTFVYTGFRPAYVMAKRTDVNGNSWSIKDTKRFPNNVMNGYLFADSSSAEGTASSLDIDFTSNGFKWRGTSSDGNHNSGNYIYIAFAETPFKYSNAR